MNDPLIGRQLANYRIERLIGRGGMASVYYATDIRLNRAAAVKVIDAHFRDREAYTARFVQEARAVASWRHANIINIYYAGDEDGLYYFAMEYIEGTSLAQILTDLSTEGQFMPTADVLRYGRAIASALDYAHQRGVIHRDVKPLNVLVAEDGRVVLTDFGLALDMAQGSLGEVFGTAHYTAPEQARRSNAAVPQSDLYSLGVILYEMLTGAVPFDDPSPTSVALQHITMPPPPPRQVNPNLNTATEAVLLRSLAKSPAERFSSGAALMDSLEAALQDLPDHAGGPSANLTHPSDQPPIADAEITPSQRAASPNGGMRAESFVRSILHLPWAGGIVVLLCLILGAVLALSLGLTRDLSMLPPPETLTTTAAPLFVPTSTMAPTGLPGDISSPVTPGISPSPELTTAALLPPSDIIEPALLPTATAIIQVATPTLRYSDRRRFLLYYNDTSFYMLQRSGVGDLIAGVSFERLDAKDQPLNRFSGNRWADYSQSSLLGWCFRLEISGAGSYLRPDDCEGKYMATLHFDPGDPGIFWTTQEGSDVFRVLWREEELVRCAIAAGTCEVYLP